MKRRLLVWIGLLLVIIVALLIRVQFVITERDAVKTTNYSVQQEKGIPVDVYRLKKKSFISYKNLGSKRVKGKVFQSMITSDLRSKIVKGSNVIFKKNGVNGKVISVESSMDLGTGLFLVRIHSDKIIKDNEKIYPISIEVEANEKSRMIPVAAVRNGVVWVVKDGKAYARKVGLGESNGTQVIINKGVGFGDRVIVHGLSNLTEAAAVYVGVEL